MAVQIRHQSLFRKIEISEQMIKNAKDKANDLGCLNNSIRGGKGNFVGFLGEEIVKKYLKIGDGNTYQFDLVYHNKKLEVKSKERSVPPQITYNATVAKFNIKQDCDYYVFTSILKDNSSGWICGIIPKQEFYDKAVFNKKDEKETNIFSFKSDCYNLTYDKLMDIDIIKSEGALDSLL